MDEVRRSPVGPGSADSSAKMRIEGVNVSSNCPVFTAQMNPPRKVAATHRLANMRMTITDMSFLSSSEAGFPASPMDCPAGK